MVTGACAEGVPAFGGEAPSGQGSGFGPGASGADGGTGSGSGVQVQGEPCVMGETRNCSCPGATDSTVICQADSSSSLDGFFPSCPTCASSSTSDPNDPCANGNKDGSETDTDCGGPDCAGCAAGDSCVDDSDCAAGACVDSVCEAASAAVEVCVPSATDDCTFSYAVSNFDPDAVDPAAAGAATTVDCDATIDTGGTPSFTSFCGGTEPPIFVQSQGGGLEIAVLAVNQLTVSGSLRVQGSRPLVIAAWADVTIAAGGSIDVGADGTTSGAGGGQCGAGMGQGGDSPSTSGDTGGGGGGGFGTAGGAGGTGDNGVEPAGEGGVVHGTPELSPLAAGCRGGHTTECSSGGGGGGGALQISARGKLVVSGSINADGGNATNSNCGAGGGSGGGILLQAVDVDVTSASLSAGGGNGADASAGGPNGASGSSSDSAPGDNGREGNGSDGGSGGGGGYGRIHVKAEGGSCSGTSCS